MPSPGAKVHKPRWQRVRVVGEVLEEAAPDRAKFKCLGLWGFGGRESRACRVSFLGLGLLSCSLVLGVCAVCIWG